MCFLGAGRIFKDAATFRYNHPRSSQTRYAKNLETGIGQVRTEQLPELKTSPDELYPEE